MGQMPEKTQVHRLADARSPYLRQHAENPVAWYPWGPEALALAREQQRPIFLSIGYSTCHWCHVMARESFQDEEIAAILNRSFVPIKVDREERPDLDHLYMTAVQALTGGAGGWPLSVFLTPELEPFYGGTYFPPEDRPSLPGFRTVLLEIARLWDAERGELKRSAETLTRLLRDHALRDTRGGLDEELLTRAYEHLHASFDEQHGGFGRAPKFPMPHGLSYLLRYAHRTGDERAVAMVTHTLNAMAAGGIRDHVGGGFHRYATDREWRIPHFEKMLYDQAGLAIAYINAHLVTGKPEYALIARETLDYVLDVLRAPEGGFYSAEDADSEGEEGTFYAWTVDELRQHLGPSLAERFAETYHVRPEGNWEGRNILYRDPLAPDLTEACRVLREVRARRPRPHRDEKIIVAWNGFMIAALCRAGRALGEERYITAAEGAAAFLQEHLWHEERLQRFYLEGAAPTPAFLDDYAYLGRGLLALYETTFDPRHLNAARRIADDMASLFAAPGGAFHLAGRDGEVLPASLIAAHDGALPSGNAAASLFLLRLGALLGDRIITERGREVLHALAGRLRRAPSDHLELLAAFDFELGPVTEIVFATAPPDPRSNPPLRAMLLPYWARYLPNSVAGLRTGDEMGELLAWIPGPVNGTVTAYVCHARACRRPIQRAEDLAQALDGR